MYRRCQDKSGGGASRRDVRVLLPLCVHLCWGKRAAEDQGRCDLRRDLRPRVPGKRDCVDRGPEVSVQRARTGESRRLGGAPP